MFICCALVMSWRDSLGDVFKLAFQAFQTKLEKEINNELEHIPTTSTYIVHRSGCRSCHLTRTNKEPDCQPGIGIIHEVGNSAKDH